MSDMPAECCLVSCQPGCGKKMLLADMQNEVSACLCGILARFFPPSLVRLGIWMNTGGLEDGLALRWNY